MALPTFLYVLRVLRMKRRIIWARALELQLLASSSLRYIETQVFEPLAGLWLLKTIHH
jgi:hypothetical protein